MYTETCILKHLLKHQNDRKDRAEIRSHPKCFKTTNFEIPLQSGIDKILNLIAFRCVST